VRVTHVGTECDGLPAMTPYSPDPLRLLILGLGNALCSDDGLGIVAVRHLACRYAPAPGVAIVDGSTQGLSLLPLLAAAERAIVVDAISANARPGSLVQLEGAGLLGMPARAHAGLAGLLHGLALLGTLPSPLVLLGLVPQTLDIGMGCSPTVEARLPDLVAQVLAEARRSGFTLAPRISADLPLPSSRSLLAGLLRSDAPPRATPLWGQ
jgi:hydrogenase maturation protease